LLLPSSVARSSLRRYPLPHEREPDDDDDAAPRAAFGRRIARGIDAAAGDLLTCPFDPQGVRYRCPQ
jgi:hypothetical protein